MMATVKRQSNAFLKLVTTFMRFHYAIIRRTLLTSYGSKYPMAIDFATSIFTICFLFISLTIVIISGIYKSIIYTYLRLRFGRHFHGLITGTDILSIMTPECDGSIHGLTECSTQKSYNGYELYTQVCIHIQKKVFQIKVDKKLFSTREYTILGYNYFRKAPLPEVEQIVKYIKSPYKHANDSIDQAELMDLAQQYFNSDLPMNNKFNWDICICLNPIINSYQENFPERPKTHFVIFTRMHHTLGDGLVIYNLLVNNIFQMGSEFKTYAETLVNKCSHLEGRPTPNHVYKFGYKSTIERPCLFRDGRHHLKSLYTSKVEEPSNLCFLKKMKLIREKFPGVITFNIFMAAFSASLADYYLKHNTIEMEIPERMLSYYPVQLNIKRFLDIYASSKDIKLSNEVSSYAFDCPIIPRDKSGVPIEDYLVERMLDLKIELHKAFNSMDAQANYIWFNVYYGVLPYPMMRWLFKGIFVQTLTTCMPGGPRLKLFNDDHVENITYFLSRQYYSSMLISMNTYDRRLQIGITADEEKIGTMRNLNVIRDGIFFYLDLLYEQCMKYNPIQKQ